MPLSACRPTGACLPLCMHLECDTLCFANFFSPFTRVSQAQLTGTPPNASSREGTPNAEGSNADDAPNATSVMATSARVNSPESGIKEEQDDGDLDDGIDTRDTATKYIAAADKGEDTERTLPDLAKHFRVGMSATLSWNDVCKVHPVHIH